MGFSNKNNSSFSNSRSVSLFSFLTKGFSGGGLAVINPLLILVVLALVGIGLFTVYTVTLTDTDYSFSRQILGVCIGFVAMIFFWLLDYKIFAKLVLPLFILDIVLIILPMIPGLGIEVNGASSWIKIGSMTFQPSELAKPVTIVMLASYVSRFEGNLTSGKDFLMAFALFAVPFVLLAREDLGTGLVILFVGFVILFLGGCHRRWLIISFMVAILGIVGLFMVNSMLNDYSGGQVKLIKEYQMSRLLVFIDQDNADYKGDAYNLNQAKIAVGSGEISGKGVGNATQSTGGFLPESATDFIFCAYAEQFGFLGTSLLLALYLALLVVSLSIGLKSNDLCGSLIVGGVMGMWVFQIIENIGMDLGLMPITGIPLPFMSFGSSFMLTNFICVGFLMSIWSRRGNIESSKNKRQLNKVT